MLSLCNLGSVVKKEEILLQDTLRNLNSLYVSAAESFKVLCSLFSLVYLFSQLENFVLPMDVLSSLFCFTSLFRNAKN